jgi:hypothetical protein
MASFLIVKSNSMFYRIYSHMSLIKWGRNCLSLSKIWSAKGEAKSTVSNAFKNPELLSIKLRDGVILE